MPDVVVSTADAEMIEHVKMLADAHRHVFGFIPRAAFVDAMSERALLVALLDGRVVGFLRFHHRRRDTQTTLYDICVDQAYRQCGIGRLLIETLYEVCRAMGHNCVTLRCSTDLPANGFYRRLGFISVRSVVGKRRALTIWRRAVQPWAI